IGFVALAWMGGLALLLGGALLVVRSIEGADRRLAPVGAALVGIALLYRPDLALAAFVAAIVLARQVHSHRLGRAVAVGFGLGVAATPPACCGSASSPRLPRGSCRRRSSARTRRTSRG